MGKPQRLQQLLLFDQRVRRRLKLRQGLLAGVDEAGRGPLAGPVVAAAVLLYHTRFTVPVDDSKRLSPSARERAFASILRAGLIGVGATSHEEIDRIGIQAATQQAMLQALDRLPVSPEWVLLDGRTVPEGCRLAALPIVGGDAKSLVVACASIVAKVTRDRWMARVDRLQPEYGFGRHKGYGTPEHLHLLRSIGPGLFHRYSFRPIRPESG